MEVYYNADNNESVKIDFSERYIRFVFSYNISGIAISDNKKDLENIDLVGKQVLSNYYKHGGFTEADGKIDKVYFVFASSWECYYSTDVSTESPYYLYLEYGKTYYYRLLGFGQNTVGNDISRLWLSYGDIATLTTPQQ